MRRILIASFFLALLVSKCSAGRGKPAQELYKDKEPRFSKNEALPSRKSGYEKRNSEQYDWGAYEAFMVKEESEAGRGGEGGSQHAVCKSLGPCMNARLLCSSFSSSCKPQFIGSHPGFRGRTLDDADGPSENVPLP